MKRTRRTEASDKVFRWPFLKLFLMAFLFLTCNFNIKKSFFLARKLLIREMEI